VAKKGLLIWLIFIQIIQASRKRCTEVARKSYKWDLEMELINELQFALGSSSSGWQQRLCVARL
jgi:ABC-type phosphate transport system ATPase subunit